MAENEDAIWRQRVEDLFQHSPTVLAFLTGPDHVYRMASECFLDLIGHRDVIGKSVREALPGLQGQGFAGEEYFALLDRVYATGEAFWGQELPVRVHKHDGTIEEHCFTVVIQPTYEHGSTVSGLLIQGMDVTSQVLARRHSEEALTREQAARAAADRAADRTSRLQAVTAALSEAITPLEVIQVVVEQGASALQAIGASVALVTEDGSEIEVVYSHGYDPDILQLYQRFPLDAGVPLAETIRSKTAIWIESSEAWAERYPKILPAHHRCGYQAAAALPLPIRNRVIGSIGFSFAGQQAFDAEDRDFMATLVQQCVQALDRARLYEAAHRQAALLALVHDAIVVWDLATARVQFWNQGAERLYGWREEEALGRVMHDLLLTQFPQLREEIEAQVQETGRWEGELIRTARDGRRITVLSRWTLERGGENSHPSAILEICTDITEQKEAQAALEHLALHDALTDLPNRVLFQDRLQHALQIYHRDGDPLALLALDLVEFKKINDTLGHHGGDVLLRQVSDRLRQLLRASDTAARLGGDEFAVILPATDASGAVQTAQKIGAALEMPFVLDGERAQIGANIGIALCPQHSEDEQRLLRQADAAMYAAKRAGGGHALYDRSLSSPLQGQRRRDAAERIGT